MLYHVLNGHKPKLNPITAQQEANPAATPSTLTDALPNPEMTPKATRRRFTNGYKLSIIEQVDACHDRGQLGALLRREGLYYSTLANFRRQKAQGMLLAEPNPAKQLRAARDPRVLAALAQHQELERENRTLRRQLARAQEIITIQKKAAFLLGETLQEMEIGEMEIQDEDRETGDDKR